MRFFRREKGRIEKLKPSVGYCLVWRASCGWAVEAAASLSLVIAFVFIVAGFFVAFLTFSGTFEKTGFEFLSGFNMYVFGMRVLLLYFGMHGH